jgi:hypothetical protein
LHIVDLGREQPSFSDRIRPISFSKPTDGHRVLRDVLVLGCRTVANIGVDLWLLDDADLSPVRCRDQVTQRHHLADHLTYADVPRAAHVGEDSLARRQVPKGRRVPRSATCSDESGSSDFSGE